MVLFYTFMTICLEVILRSSIVVVCSILANSATRCCMMVKLSCGVGGMMIFVRVC